MKSRSNVGHWRPGV